MKKFFQPFSASFSLFRWHFDSKQIFYKKVCRWLDSNRGPVVSEATLYQLRHTHCPMSCKSLAHFYCIFLFLGANPNSEDLDSRTPLHSAIVKGSRYQPMTANRLTQDSNLLKQKNKIHNFLDSKDAALCTTCVESYKRRYNHSLIPYSHTVLWL